MKIFKFLAVVLFLSGCSTISTDILVVGGGTAGGPAAVEAAASGCDVTLVEAGGQLGGTMTTGGVCFPGLFHAHGRQVISGIGWDLVNECVQMDGGTLPDFTKPYGDNHPQHQILINPGLYAALAEEKCTQAGVRLRYYETPVKVRRCLGRWYVQVYGKGTFKTIRCKEIIDATGNASVVALAGYERVRSRNPQPGSLIFELGGYDLDALDFDVLDSLYAAAHSDGRLSRYDCYLPIRNLLTVHRGLSVSHVPGADSSTSESHSESNITGRSGMLRLLRVLKTFPGLENLTVKSVQSEVAVRESWRIRGLYEITVEDYVSGRLFDDVVSYSFYPIDLHDESGVRPQQLDTGRVATVPLRSLIPAGSRHILVAGRCISSDQKANSALRVQATCMATGQAAGAAAALAVRHGVTPSEISVDELRYHLSTRGAVVPSVPAKWISADHPQADEPNTWMEFEKTFSVGRIPENVEALIAADSKYWLWINGELVVFEGGLKRGPDPESSYHDVVEIAPYLRKGDNHLRLLLCHFGKDGFSHKDSGKAAFIFDASRIGLVSDSTWSSRRLSCYQSAGEPVPNYRLSESNIRYDARLEDSDPWHPSAERGLWGDEPWGRLVRRPVPQWKDYGVRDAEFTVDTDADGNTVFTVRLPYNMQLTPVIDVTDNGEGTCIRMETNHVRGGSEWCIRAEYLTRKGRQQYESLGWMNGEELYVILPAGSDVKVHGIGYRETGFGCEREGTFCCSDEMVNRFWEKAMRTLYVNMRDTYFDCPDRERAQWWGDVTVLTGQTYYQLSPVANTLTCKAIHELVNWQKDNGVLYSPVPAGSWVNELPAQMLASISTYGFWYYYMHTGDARTMADVYPAVKRYLDLWTLDGDGLTAYRHGDWSWGDWGEDIDIRLILASWHYLALESAANMAELTGNGDDVPAYRELQDSIRDAYNRCWNGCEYRHPSYKDETDDRVNAMAVITGIADESRYAALYEHFRKHEHASPYMEKYVLEALVKMGYGEFALERFKKRFGPMVNDRTYTTLFEGWEVGGFGGGSTNHAWSGGMLTVIAEDICGVRPVVPGWEVFEVSPYPVISECDIVIPTVRGKVRSSFKKQDECFTLDLTVPVGTKAKVNIPASYEVMTVNGRNYDGDWFFGSGTYEFVCRSSNFD